MAEPLVWQTESKGDKCTSCNTLFQHDVRVITSTNHPKLYMYCSIVCLNRHIIAGQHTKDLVNRKNKNISVKNTLDTPLNPAYYIWRHYQKEFLVVGVLNTLVDPKHTKEMQPILLSDFKDDELIPAECPDAHLERLFSFSPEEEIKMNPALLTLYKTYFKKRNALLVKYYKKQLLIVARDDGSNPAIVSINDDETHYTALKKAVNTTNIKVYCIVTPGKCNTSDLRLNPT